MCSLTKKIIVVTSLLVLSSEQHALGSNNDNNDCNQGVNPVERSQGVKRTERVEGLTDEDLTQAKDTSTQLKGNVGTEAPAETPIPCPNPELYQIDNLVFANMFQYMSNHMYPWAIRLVCRRWRDLLDRERDLTDAYAPTEFPKEGPLMQRCLTIWWANEDPKRFNNMILRYSCLFPEDLQQKNGTFVLPSTYTGRVRITTKVQEFLKTGGDNAGKTIVLAVLYKEAVKAISSMETNHPFVRIVRDWDLSQAAAGFFIRGGNGCPAGGFYYLTTASFARVSRMRSLSDILRDSRESWNVWDSHRSFNSDLACFRFIFPETEQEPLHQ